MIIKMSKNPYGFIYITTNLINGKKYIGQKKFDNRSRWQSYLGSGYHLTNAIKKYGRDNFYRDIIHICYTEEELDNMEYEYIKFHDAVKSNDYYNKVDGGLTCDSLTNRNSIKCICLNHGNEFNSIVDAATWYSCSTVKISNSFNSKFTIGQEELVFRPLRTKKGKELCIKCGNYFLSRYMNNSQCKKCSKLKFFKCSVCDIINIKNNNSHRYCTKCKKERKQEISDINNQRKSEISSKKTNNKTHKQIREEKLIFLNSNKNLIITMYKKENLSISKILKNIECENVIIDAKTLKDFLVEHGVFNPEKPSIINIQYIEVRKRKSNDIVDAFDNLWECSQWMIQNNICEKYHLAKNYIRNSNKNNVEYQGYVFKYITKDDYIKIKAKEE